MDVYKIFLASLLGFALLNYFVIPSAKKKWDANKSLAKVSKAGVLGALNFARTFLLIAALTYLALSVFIFLQGISAGVTTAELKAAAEKIQKYRDIISSTQKYLVGWIALMLIAILALLSCRREKRHLQEDFAEKIARERERLQREAEEGRWEPLPPTQEMRALLERIQTAQQTYDLLESGRVLVNGDINAHRETLRKAIRELRDAWHALDFERRIQISFDSDPSSSNESQRSGKFGDFISSKGFLASMKTASRSLSHAGTALLVISLVGVSGASVSNNLEAQQVRWNDLIVAANQKEIKEKFDRLLAQNPTEAVKKEDDDKTKKENKAVYNYLARNFERSLAQSTVWRSAQQSEHSNTTSRRNAVKSEILSETRTSTSDAYKKYWDDGSDTPTSDRPEPKPPKPGPKTGPGSNHPSSERTPSAQSADDAARGRTVVEVPEPETLIGKQVAKDLEATLEKRPNLLARIKAKIVRQIGQFSEPAEITDAADYAFSEIFGTFVDSSVGTASSEVNNLLSKVGKSAIKNSGKETYQILYQRMMNDLAGETSVADTYGHIRTFASADFPIVKTATLTPLSEAALSLTSSEEYAKYLEQHPPALADNPLDARELELAAEKFKTTYDQKRPTVELNAFASYDDIYKAQSTTRTQTLKERLVAELRNEAPRAEEITSTSADFSRSRSFAELVGHSDTGGVLIGKAPDDVSQAGDFIDLRWTIDNKLLSLVLIRADGKEFPSVLTKRR